jgi:hypothetical protein
MQDRNKKREYLKAKINELEINSKNKNIRELYRGINDFKKGYQPRTNIVKDEKGDLVADCHSILTRWINCFSQLLNVHGDNDVKQTEIHTAEPLVPEPSALEVEMAIEKLKRYKSPGTDQIPAELIKAGGSKICCEIHKLIISIWNNEELPDQWKESIVVPVYKKGDKTDSSNYCGISPFISYIQNSIKHPSVKVNPICRINYWGSSVWVSTLTGQQLIIYSAFVKYSRKNGNTMGRCISYL